MSPRHRRPFSWRAPLLAGALSLSNPARADVVDDVGRRLSAHEEEAMRLSSGVRRPPRRAQRSRGVADRRLIDAQVAFGMGDYDDAAVMLYDYVEKNPNSPSYDSALYYLGEALFLKRDYVAARTYFAQLVEQRGPSSRYYQQALERLLELTLELNDGSDVAAWLKALDNIPEGKLRPSVPYVRGKYAYFQDDFDTALRYFNKIGKNSAYWFQSRYFVGTTHIAKGQLGKAARAFEELTEVRARNKDERRVVELAQMALGRIHYERDQPSKAIDRYLMVSRRSDLFDEALYEVAWVYVKNKDFDKALRALELLALTDPSSSKLPYVNILEGNLRIRRARNINDMEATRPTAGNSEEEYSKALEVFEKTRDLYADSHEQLTRIKAEQTDPRAFLDQITGRASDAFQVKSTLPPVAAAWLRQEPEVGRVIEIEGDLGKIREEIVEAEATIGRLEQAMNSTARFNIFPDLAARYTRSVDLQEDIFRLRRRLASEGRRIAMPHAFPEDREALRDLAQKREHLAALLDALPHADAPYSQRIELARRDYQLLDKESSEVVVILDSTESQLTALKKYMAEGGEKVLQRKDAVEVQKTINEVTGELDQLRSDLEGLRRETTLARDLVASEMADNTLNLRGELQVALDEEQRVLDRIAKRARGADRAKLDQISGLAIKASAINTRLAELTQTINEVVDSAFAEIRDSMVEEKARLVAYKREFSNYGVESRDLGGQVLATSFDAVTGKFHDILIRSDVGVVDVAWSRKESTDEHKRRVTLDQARERKILDSEYSEVIEAARAKQQQQPETTAPEGGKR
jgi:tetratricopeptide (TPR) repeat protein